MESWPALPSVAFSATPPIGGALVSRGVSSLRDAGRYLCELPYGRNSDRSDFMLVLAEGRGTCSTKHALLAALAREQGIALRLMLGIYEMREANTPGVGKVLAKHGLVSVPEAHCYVAWGDARIDVTRSGVEPAEPVGPFLREETIAPEQIGDYKVCWHQGFMRDWVGDQGRTNGIGFDELWEIREECIRALEQ